MKRRCIRVAELIAVLSLGVVAPAGAAESDPLPVPAQNARANAVVHYNDGVALLLARRFAEAQRKFEAALTLDESLAEAHNNLAYVLRMQGRHNFAASLTHYNRALALKPRLAQAYMYRGVLFMQQGDRERARQDLEKLRTLDTRLALELERVLDGGDANAERGGVAAQYE